MVVRVVWWWFQSIGVGGDSDGGDSDGGVRIFVTWCESGEGSEQVFGRERKCKYVYVSPSDNVIV